MSSINDGAGTTLMFAENINKSYESTTSNGAPAFAWLFGNEQQLGFVWVVPTTGTAPQPGNTINNQEALNRADATTYPAEHAPIRSAIESTQRRHECHVL